MNVTTNKKLFSTSKTSFQSCNPSFKSSKNSRRFPQNPENRNRNGYQNRTGQYQKQYSSNNSNKYPKQKKTLKLVGPLKFHDNILTELQKDVENFKGGNLRHFSKN